METNFEKVNVFVKENQDKIKTPMFVASAIVFIAFFTIWGISKDGLLNGITVIKNLITDNRDFIGFNGEISIMWYLMILFLFLIPISSGFLAYSSWHGTKNFVKLAKIVLLISIFPYLPVVFSNPIKAFGLAISIIAIAYMFFPKIGDKVICQVDDFIKKQKNDKTS
ncbi:MAG: hypothetical protein RBT49_16695 [Bacteroidales bacterium]|nr:hypothetical protein [Bacteroidales bacterium]